MSPTLVDLRPNRHLLDHNFEGYKLNLQSLPHYSCDLDCRVDRLYPDEAQYSFVHAKLFALHNHLVLDYWDHSYNYYYIDINRQVRHIAFENTSHTFQNKVVYDVPMNVERKSGHFNLSLAFPSSELALISDGTGYLHILKTGPRNRSAGGNVTWEAENTFLVLGEDKYFDIVDSRVQEMDNTLLLHCLIQSVEHNYIHFKSVLSWVTYTLCGKIWKQTSFRRIEGKGIIHYAALETRCGALYIASDNGFEFTADSEKDKEPADPLIRLMERKLLYTWHQSHEDLCITLKLEPNFNRDYFQCEVDLYSIKVSYAGKDIIDGKLMARVDAELTTWDIQNNGQVDILITKYQADTWDDLLEYMDERGEQIMDPLMLEATHQRLSHLCSEVIVTADQPLPGLPTQQLEECDAPSDEDTVLVRFDLSTHQITHRVPLSVHQYLFSIRIEPNEAPILGLRHDVDACIWQPYAQVINSKIWPVRHQGTLMAFGYVQSSKQNKKFVTCPPNLSYSVVSEASRHVFIYQSPNNSDGQLRKRSGGVVKPVNVGNQHVFNIDKYGEVVGINATNEFLFILTETKLVAIKVQ